MKLAAVVAVVLLAACAGDPPPQNTDPGVATYAIDATGVHCDATSFETEFAFGSADAHLCRWNCITYHGESQRIVTLMFTRPVDANGEPSGQWTYSSDMSEPSQYCPPVHYRAPGL
jgi:hypothetical protein